MNRIKVIRKYWALIDSILDYVGSSHKEIDKKKLHKSFKEAKGINSIRDLTNDELRDFVSEIEAFVHHDLMIEYKPNTSLKALLKQTNKEYEQQHEKNI